MVLQQNPHGLEGLVLHQRAHECQNDDILLSLEIKAKTILSSHPDCLFDCSFRQWGLAKPTDRNPMLLVLWLIPFQDLKIWPSHMLMRLVSLYPPPSHSGMLSHEHSHVHTYSHIPLHTVTYTHVICVHFSSISNFHSLDSHLLPVPHVCLGHWSRNSYPGVGTGLEEKTFQA